MTCKFVIIILPVKVLTFAKKGPASVMKLGPPLRENRKTKIYSNYYIAVIIVCTMQARPSRLTLEANVSEILGLVGVCAKQTATRVSTAASLSIMVCFLQLT